MQFLPVNPKALPLESNIASCLNSLPSSKSSIDFTAISGVKPTSNKSKPLGPNDGLMKDRVATTPTPARPQATKDPTANQWD